MPIFIARTEKEGGGRVQTKCTTIHTGHTGLCVRLWHTQHDTPHSCCTKNMCNEIPQTAAQAKQIQKTKGEREIEMIFHNL